MLNIFWIDAIYLFLQAVVTFEELNVMLLKTVAAPRGGLRRTRPPQFSSRSIF
jgi:hypothetical protein